MQQVNQAHDRNYLLPEYWPLAAPRISGTAMPTGVHLSDGWFKTSSSLELVLTGVAIMGMGAIAAVVSFLITWLLDGITPVPTTALLLGLVTGGPTPDYVYWQIGLNLLMFICFLTVLRLSPMSGYHAAEHMTVTAIERLGRLVPEEVRRMPRAHPRCGTNLLAAILPTLLIAVPLWSLDPQLAALIALAGYLGRAQIGWALQQFFTTKDPTDRQLEAGLRAGRKILRARQNFLPRPQSLASRLWQRGFPQMAIGVFLAMYGLGWIYGHLHLWLDW